MGLQSPFQQRKTSGASVEVYEDTYHLEIPPGGTKNYRLAQLDDYAQYTRKNYPNRPPIRLNLYARVSTASHPGTWGFGLWNDPFMVSFGLGEAPFRLPALPNAVWFFHASQENYLSFTDKPGNGFLVQAFRSPSFPLGGLARIAAALPFSRKVARAWMGKIVEEDGTRLGLDPTEWHGYSLEWSPKRSAFWVDDALVFETNISPRPPLGLVIWIDNMQAAWRPDGKIRFGVLATSEPAWLEIKDLELV
jgi:hypothetical protein